MSQQKQNIQMATNLAKQFDALPLEGDADDDGMLVVYVARKTDPEDGIQYMKHIGGYNGSVDTLRQMIIHLCEEMPAFKHFVIEVGTTFAAGGYFAAQGTGTIIVDEKGNFNETS
jgi:hypothetical protein